MVSYARARAEGLNVAGGRVLFERPERVLTLLFGLIAAAIFGDAALLPFIYVLAIGANIGAIYRMRACWMRLQ
jgi:CDP-diacylglycerol--glycerol-3-phosphate 3-phosphatidyltransferase